MSHCRLSPELPRGPAYIASDHAQIDLESGKPKIWSVTDFLSSAQQQAKDGHPGLGGTHGLGSSLGLGSPTGLGLGSTSGMFPKLDSMKPGADPAADVSRTNGFLGRPSASPSSTNGLTPLTSPSQHLSAYQSSLGYSPSAYPYGLSSYGGGKLPIRPSLSTPDPRFNPFPSVRPASMDPAYGPRRDLTLGREGE